MATVVAAENGRRERRRTRRAARATARRTFDQALAAGMTPEAAADEAEEAVRAEFGTGWIAIATLIIEFITRLLEAFRDDD